MSINTSTAGTAAATNSSLTILLGRILLAVIFLLSGFGKLTAISGTAGYFGASLFAVFVGYMVQGAGNYMVPFICAGSAYLVAFAVIHMLVPNIRPARIKNSAADPDSPVL